MTSEKEHIYNESLSEVKCLVCGSELIKHEYRLDFGDVFQCESCNYAFTQFDNVETSYEAQEDWGSANWIKSKIYLLSDSRKGEESRLKVLQKFNSGKNLLEFGTNVGSFLWVADKAGFKVSGTDIHSNLLNMNKVKGLQYFQADAMTSNFDKKFDVIVGFQFLEHLDNPLKFLCNLRNSINVGGLLFFEVPNYNSKYRLRDGGKWQHFNRGHFSHFNASSFKKIMESAGYKVIYQSSLQPPSFTVDPYYLPVRHGLWRMIKKITQNKQSSTNNISSIISDEARTLSLEEELKIHYSFKAKITRLERNIMNIFYLLFWPYNKWLGNKGQGDVIQIIATKEKPSSLNF